jgi:hypothetical protein
MDADWRPFFLSMANFRIAGDTSERPIRSCGLTLNRPSCLDIGRFSALTYSAVSSICAILRGNETAIMLRGN